MINILGHKSELFPKSLHFEKRPTLLWRSYPLLQGPACLEPRLGHLYLYEPSWEDGRAWVVQIFVCTKNSALHPAFARLQTRDSHSSGPHTRGPGQGPQSCLGEMHTGAIRQKAWQGRPGSALPRAWDAAAWLPPTPLFSVVAGAFTHSRGDRDARARRRSIADERQPPGPDPRASAPPQPVRALRETPLAPRGSSAARGSSPAAA